MHIEDFEYLIMIHECGSISAAAKKLFMSQPLLSQKIRSLETKLGIELLDRRKYPLQLTYAGEQTLATALKIREARKELEQEISEIKGEYKGLLRIGISAHRSIMLTKILPEYQRLFPKVEISIHDHTSTTYTNLLLDKQIDFALLSVHPANYQPELEYVPLSQDRVLLFSGPDTSIARNRSIGDVISICEAKDEPFITLQEHFGFYTSQTQIFAKKNIVPRVVLTAQSIELSCRLATACNCVALCPEAHPMESELLRKDAHYVYIAPDEYEREFALAFCKDMHLVHYMKDFIQRVQTVYSKS